MRVCEVNKNMVRDREGCRKRIQIADLIWGAKIKNNKKRLPNIEFLILRR